MQELSVIVSLSIIAEALTEYLTFTLPKNLSWAKLYAGMAAGVVLCLLYNSDLMPLLGLPNIPIAGSIITGLLIGRGSNIANDLFKRLRLIQMPAAPTDVVLQQGIRTAPAEPAQTLKATGKKAGA